MKLLRRIFLIMITWCKQTFFPRFFADYVISFAFSVNSFSDRQGLWVGFPILEVDFHAHVQWITCELGRRNIVNFLFLFFVKILTQKLSTLYKKRKLQNYFDFAKPQRPNRRLFLRLLGIPYTEMNVNGCWKNSNSSNNNNTIIMFIQKKTCHLVNMLMF